MILRQSRSGPGHVLSTLLLLLIVSCSIVSSLDSSSEGPTTMPQFSNTEPHQTGAPTTPAIIITDTQNNSASVNNITNPVPTSMRDEEDQEQLLTTVVTEDPGPVFVTGYISTTREDYQQDRAMESTSLGGGGGSLLFDPTGGDAGAMGHQHVPEKCHTYIPDHLAGDDDYRKCWEGQ